MNRITEQTKNLVNPVNPVKKLVALRVASTRVCLWMNSL